MSGLSFEEISKRYTLFLLALAICVLSPSYGEARKYTESDELESDVLTESPAPQKPTKSNANLGPAETAFQEKNYKKVVELLTPQLGKLSTAGYSLLARSHLELKSWNDVLKVTQLGLAQNSKDSELLTYQGMANFELGKDKIAIEDLKAALEANPKNEKAYEASARIYEKRKNNYELRTIYQDMIDKIGPRPKYYAALCRVDTKDVLNDSAIENCKEAIRRNPKDVESTINLAIVHSHTGNTKEAEKLFVNTTNEYPQSETAQQRTGEFFEEKKNFIRAIKYYDSCIKLNPKSETCLKGIIQSELQVQKFSDAATHMRKLCTLDRRHSLYARKGMTAARTAKNSEWEKTFNDIAQDCSL